MIEKHIAYICYDNPYLKPMEGGKRGILTRIEALANCGYSIDLYLLSKPMEHEENDLIDKRTARVNCLSFKMKSSPVMLFGPYPICMQKRYVTDAISELQKHHYDAALYEGEQVSLYRLKNNVNADRHILYFVDIESVYRKELAKAEQSLVRKSLQYREARKFKALERNLDQYFDYFLFISNQERDLYLGTMKIPAERAVYAPYAVTHFRNNTVGSEQSQSLLYVGDLSLENNFLSLLWFCENVFTIVSAKNPNASLRIVGKIDNEKRAKLEGISSAINVLGYVDSINDEYAMASCVVCPVLFGAGVKAKVVDAISEGQIVIANQKAIEGTGLLGDRHLLISDDEKHLADICLDVLGNRGRYVGIAREGLNYVSKEHSVANHEEILRKVLEN